MESVSISNLQKTYVPASGLFEKMAKSMVLKAFSNIVKGHLLLEEDGEQYHFGEAVELAEHKAHIIVRDGSAYRDFFFNGTVGSAEAYMRRAWTTPDLLAVIQLMVSNLDWLSRFNARRPWLSRTLFSLAHFVRANTKTGSRKNIAAHYDLGNDFFELFLDPTMMYSSAIFAQVGDSLESASRNKLEVICQKLELSEADHLLEIGTGWGGMAIYAAQNYACRVTTTTISKAQYEYACHKVRALGLNDKITVLLKDYRELEGQFDKLVSIEMIEAVGHQFYEKYFRVCNRLLRPNGLMLLQAITIPDQRFDVYKSSVDFIKKYIFPGGCLPSNEIIASSVRRYTDMQIVNLHDITEHYASTLAHWWAAFEAKIDKVKAQGFDGRFCRMWEFYLRYCEGGFRERVISTSQILLAKPEYRFD